MHSEFRRCRMHRFRQCTFFVIMIALVLFASLSSASAETYRNPATGLLFPDSMAGMKKVKVTVFESPQLGVGIGYNLPGVSMTVFIYDLGMKSIPADINSPLFKGQFDQAIADIFQAERMGVLENVKRLPGDPATMMPGPSGRKALSASFTFGLQGQEKNSKLFLTQYKNNWVKLRYTYDRNVQNRGEEIFNQFLKELADTMEKAR